MFWLDIAKTYDKINSIFRAVFKRNLRGVGYLLRKIKRDHVLMFHGQKMFFNHKVAGCYVSLINGKYTETETHLFFRKIIKGLDCHVNFVDVGANVGEFILDLSLYNRVKNIYAFEPHPECAKTCRINVLLNGYDNKVKVIQKILSQDTAPVNFSFNSIAPNASGIVDNVINSETIYPSTLDIELHDFSLPTILLIDVEGSEPLVMKGGKYFISMNKPLIIFEYNTTSKKHFNLNDVKDILGTQYEIYRLRNDGYLDNQFDDTWNCVAVNISSDFYHSAKSLLI
jgi:FkbM family methyltransferase